MQMRFNYHTHTERCFHAHGEDEAFVLAAIEAGFDEIGFADHSPWPFEGGYVSGMRMHADELENYVNSIRYLKEKYKDKISIKIGLECEYFKEYMPWLEKSIEELKIDYIILGHHHCTNEIGGKYNGFITEPEDIIAYKNEVVEAVHTGLYSYICHPDLYMKGYPAWDKHCEKVAEEIIAASIETGVPLEYNLLGLSRSKIDGTDGYPHPNFWDKVAKMGGKAIIGIDAHNPDDYFDRDLFEEAQENLRNLGIETVESIKFFR